MRLFGGNIFQYVGSLLAHLQTHPFVEKKLQLCRNILQSASTPGLSQKAGEMRKQIMLAHDTEFCWVNDFYGLSTIWSCLRRFGVLGYILIFWGFQHVLPFGVWISPLGICHGICK